MSLAFFVMASSSPSCEIRQLLVHVYPGGSKAPGAERLTVFYGCRGRPVKKPRLMPAALAHQWARKLQARWPGLWAASGRLDSLNATYLTVDWVLLALLLGCWPTSSGFSRKLRKCIKSLRKNRLRRRVFPS